MFMGSCSEPSIEAEEQSTRQTMRKHFLEMLKIKVIKEGIVIDNESKSSQTDCFFKDV